MATALTTIATSETALATLQGLSETHIQLLLADKLSMNQIIVCCLISCCCSSGSPAAPAGVPLAAATAAAAPAAAASAAATRGCTDQELSCCVASSSWLSRHNVAPFLAVRGWSPAVLHFEKLPLKSCQHYPSVRTYLLLLLP